MRTRTKTRISPIQALFAIVPLCLIGLYANATSIPHRTLEEIVADSDHVLIAKVVKVDMVNALGMPVGDRDARTGPGLNNRLRFHLEVQDVLFTTCRRQPSRVLVPLWSAWHYQLGTMQDQVEGSTGIFLLKGPGFEPAYPADFQRALGERGEIVPLVDSLRFKRKQLQSACAEDRRIAGA